MSHGAPAYRVPDNLAWIDGADFDLPDELYLTVVPDGRTVLLKGTARLIWLVAKGGGDVVAEVAELVGRPPAEIATDVETFLADLTSRCLLAVAP
jgi:predicted transcriptional regulator